MSLSRICPDDRCPDFVETGHRGEYAAAVAACPKCGARLVDLPTRKDDARLRPELAADVGRFVRLVRIPDVGLIPLIKSVLEDAGIPHYIKDENAQHVFGYGISGVGHPMLSVAPEVHVAPERADEARALIRDLLDGP